MAANSKTTVPPIQWAAKNYDLVWKLLDEMGKLENFKVLFGKTDSDDVGHLLPFIICHLTHEIRTRLERPRLMSAKGLDKFCAVIT